MGPYLLEALLQILFLHSFTSLKVLQMYDNALKANLSYWKITSVFRN